MCQIYLPNVMLGQQEMALANQTVWSLTVGLDVYLPRIPCDSCGERMGMPLRELIGSLHLWGPRALLGRVSTWREPSALSQGRASYRERVQTSWFTWIPRERGLSMLKPSPGQMGTLSPTLENQAK